jgi:hypothetical protein
MIQNGRNKGDLPPWRHHLTTVQWGIASKNLSVQYRSSANRATVIKPFLNRLAALDLEVSC